VPTESSAIINPVDQPHVKLSGDIEGPYVVEEATVAMVGAVGKWADALLV
jgi:hypothetical protein